jgi:hypothetical protein
MYLLTLICAGIVITFLIGFVILCFIPEIEKAYKHLRLFLSCFLHGDWEKCYTCGHRGEPYLDPKHNEAGWCNYRCRKCGSVM